MRRSLLCGVMLLTGCSAKHQREVSDCTQLYGNVSGGIRACLVNRYGWDATQANRAELQHRKILQDGRAR